MNALSSREKTALYRILATSTRGKPKLAPRQRAALDAYAEILASPPFAESEVVVAARAVIRVWAESSTPSKAKRRYIPAVLLDLEEDVFPPYFELAYDLSSPLLPSERPTEVVSFHSPL